MEQNELQCPKCGGTEFHTHNYMYDTGFINEQGQFENVEVESDLITKNGLFCMNCSSEVDIDQTSELGQVVLLTTTPVVDIYADSNEITFIVHIPNDSDNKYYAELSDFNDRVRTITGIEVWAFQTRDFEVEQVLDRESAKSAVSVFLHSIGIEHYEYGIVEFN